MTHFLQRSALILLATTALSASGLGATPALAKVHHRGHAAARRADAPEATTYTVKRGDTLDKIADQLGTSVEELRRLNRLKKSSVLRPGQRLKGPPAEKPAASGKASGSRAEASRKTYTVVHGDTLFSISKRLHVSMQDLRAANGLSGRAQIHAGQTLKLPGEAGAEQAEESAAAEAASTRGARGHRSRISPAEVAETAEASRGGRVVTVQAKGETYKARKGDTLAKVAARLGADVGEVKRLNHIKGQAVHAGQLYRGPSFAEHIYTAQPGDTLASIAQRFGVSVASLRAENELSKRVASVRPGQKVYLPDGYRDRGSLAEERPARSYPPPVQPGRNESAGLPSRPQPYTPSGQTPPRTYPTPGATAEAPQSSTPAPSDAQVTQMAKGRFQWPIRGTILSDFGPKAAGQHNDGINIQSDAGTPVRAAAEGDVVYAGDQVPGFGNVVLIKHTDGWVTVYGYLSRAEVKMQQKVTQGQEIGQVGSTGGVSEPQLHFEVRYTPSPTERARPVDPKLVLPK